MVIATCGVGRQIPKSAEVRTWASEVLGQANIDDFADCWKVPAIVKDVGDKSSCMR